METPVRATGLWYFRIWIINFSLWRTILRIYVRQQSEVWKNCFCGSYIFEAPLWAAFSRNTLTWSWPSASVHLYTYFSCPAAVAGIWKASWVLYSWHHQVAYLWYPFAMQMPPKPISLHIQNIQFSFLMMVALKKRKQSFPVPNQWP